VIKEKGNASAEHLKADLTLIAGRLQEEDNALRVHPKREMIQIQNAQE